MRWDRLGRTTGPTRISGTVIPEGAELLIPIPEPGDMEECMSCQFGRDHDVFYPMDSQEQFRLHLERHVVPTVRIAPGHVDMEES
jgi:hypothetical protein